LLGGVGKNETWEAAGLGVVVMVARAGWSGGAAAVVMVVRVVAAAAAGEDRGRVGLKVVVTWRGEVAL
jgi:hypothetical protein